MKQIKLDKEERELLTSYERGEWRPVRNMPGEITRYKEMAKKSLRKSRRINIRLVEKDLEKIQIYALREGIPYQTLISSVLHKYAAGQIIKA
jgi:predicted DNA binding CopG/RHH family protein